MSERERHETGPEANSGEPEAGRSHSSPSAEDTDAGRPTDQAVINEEQAVESGEENVV